MTFCLSPRLKKIDGPRTDVQDIVTATYDPVTGFITSVTWPLIGTTRYSDHDGLGNPRTVTDPNGNATSYHYDDLGRVYQTVSPDTGATGYTYDPAGNLKTKTDAKGVTTNYSYDAANRLTRIDFPSDTDIVYSYDTCLNGKGRLCGVTDQSGSTAYEYTKKGQTAKETRIIDGVSYVTQYTYIMNGNVKTVTYPSGRVITYNYANNNVSGVLNNGATLASTISYLPFSGITNLSYGNALTRTIGYDNQYRIATIQAGSLQSLGYGHDGNGNVTSMVNNLDNTKSKSYTYDDLNRLETGAGPWGSITWTYDPVGNRLTQVDTSGASNYNYQTGSNRLSSITGPNLASFGYDENGNTTTENAKAYSYNQNQRLIRAAASQVGDYVYDAVGQRVKKTVTGVTTHFVFDQGGQLIYETASDGNWAEYVYLNGEPLAKIDADGISYIHTDHLGTPVMMSDSSGAKVWEVEARPFGDGATATGTGSLNIRFPGQYHDAESGLNYNYFRDYNPAIGRYVEADPIGLDGGINPFVYVQNSPVNLVDPFGLGGCYVGYPGYPITMPGTNTKVPLTHAGVLSYDSEGHTRYYEYGRYNSDFGNVRRRPVPDLQIGPDGQPIPESWAKLQDALNKIGNGTKAKTSCNDKVDADKINSFAEQRMKDPKRSPYSWNPFNFNTCTTFAGDALKAGLK